MEKQIDVNELIKQYLNLVQQLGQIDFVENDKITFIQWMAIAMCSSRMPQDLVDSAKLNATILEKSRNFLRDIEKEIDDQPLNVEVIQ